MSLLSEQNIILQKYRRTSDDNIMKRILRVKKRKNNKVTAKQKALQTN